MSFRPGQHVLARFAGGASEPAVVIEVRDDDWLVVQVLGRETLEEIRPWACVDAPRIAATLPVWMPEIQEAVRRSVANAGHWPPPPSS